MKHIKKIGIIGGMGSYASAWFYNRVLDLCDKEYDSDFPEIFIHSNSQIIDRTAAITNNDSSIYKELYKSVDILNLVTADIAVMICMTAHVYYENLRSKFKGEFIDPIELILNELKQKNTGISNLKVGIIGSKGLMKSRLLHERLLASDMEAVNLSSDLIDKYFTEPVYKAAKIGETDEASKNKILKHAHLLIEQGADLVLGACSELPLLTYENMQVQYFDTFELLAKETVRRAYFIEH